jgi:CRISPR-associated protein Cas8a1/Csx13
MVCKASYEHEMERLFIAACHEAWRRQLGKLGERARRENILFSTIVGRESEKLRMSFSRCRNARDLRETVVDFWARSGSVKTLKESWSEILPMFDEHNWRTAKDLALLALASYKPANSEEEAALDTIQNSETEEKSNG